jgi:hypothetical protein
MQNKLVLAAATVIVSLTTVGADLCSIGSTEIDGNWYCQPVDAIQYSNVGTPGSYYQVTNMLSDGACTSTPMSFSGPISPLDEEVLPHLRIISTNEALLIHILTDLPALSRSPPAEATRDIYPVSLQ